MFYMVASWDSHIFEVQNSLSYLKKNILIYLFILIKIVAPVARVPRGGPS